MDGSASPSHDERVRSSQDEPAPSHDEPVGASQDKLARFSHNESARSPKEEHAASSHDEPFSSFKNERAASSRDKPAHASQDQPASFSHDEPVGASQDKSAASSQHDPFRSSENEHAASSHDGPARSSQHEPPRSSHHNEPVRSSSQEPALSSEDQPVHSFQNEPAASSQTDEPNTCIVCFDEELPHTSSDHVKFIYLSCGCAYCSECIQAQWEIALKELPFHPPKCRCREIPFHEVYRYLDPPTELALRSKKLELDVPYHERTYCSDCRKHIIPANIADGIGTCGSCGRKTCTKCKEVDHPDKTTCEPDQLGQVADELVAKYGFRRCPECGHVVERIDGCSHMVCICGTSFCYHCGAERSQGNHKPTCRLVLRRARILGSHYQLTDDEYQGEEMFVAYDSGISGGEEEYDQYSDDEVDEEWAGNLRLATPLGPPPPRPSQPPPQLPPHWGPGRGRGG